MPETPSAATFIKAKDAQWRRDRETGRVIVMKDIGRRGSHVWSRESWTFLVQYNLPTKVFCLERLRFVEWRGDPLDAHLEGNRESPLEYRFGYWVVARNGIANGRWWWAQFSPLIPLRDFDKLLAKARLEGTLVDPAP